jgi:transposase-like protein
MPHRLPNRSTLTSDPSNPSSSPFPLTLSAAPQTISQTVNGGSTPATFPASAMSLAPQRDTALDGLYTTSDLFRDFASEDVCLEYVKEQIWPKGLAHCAKCGIVRKHYRVTGRKAYACNHCGHHIYPLAGTIFSKSTTPLRTWFYILYLMLSTRGQVSARQIQRETGVTYKTAWRSRSQILALLPPDYAADASVAIETLPFPNSNPMGDRTYHVVAKSGLTLDGPREETRKKMRRIGRAEFTALAGKAIQTPSKKSYARMPGSADLSANQAS